MAFSKTPTQASSQTKLIPFVYPRNLREAGTGQVTVTRDTIANNVIFETVKNPIDGNTTAMAYKRNGTRHVTWYESTAPGTVNNDFTENVVGVYYSAPKQQQYVLTETGRLFITDWTTTGIPGDLEQTFSIASGLTNIVTQPDWADFLFDNGDLSTIMSGRNGIYTITDPGIVTYVPNDGNNRDAVVLDGYVFTSSFDGNIWNSALNNPASWPASNFISAEAYGDTLTRIARSGSYIVAFGTDSIQWFYNAANPTGSPLAVYPGATSRIGYLGGLTTVGDTLFFIGKTVGGGIRLYKAAGLKVEPVVDFTMGRQMVPFPDGYGNAITMNGHSLYAFSVSETIHSPNSPAPNTGTYLYDIDQQLFTTMTWQTSSDVRIIQTAFAKNAAGGNTSIFCRHADNKVYVVDPNLYRDDGVDFTVTLQTNLFDADTRRNKFWSRLLLHCDQITGVPGPINAFVSIVRDDGSVVEIGGNVDLTRPYPVLWRLGRSRAMQVFVQFTQNYPMRFEAVEVDYDLGIQ